MKIEKKNNDTERTQMLIPLSQDQFAIVDNKDYIWLSQWKWCAWYNKTNRSYYAVRNSKRTNGKRNLIRMHREILGLKKGNKKQGDHRNHNTLDNRRHNLRVVTNQQNKFNQKNSKGYYWYKRDQKYRAVITVDSEAIILGTFDKAKDARAAYVKAKKKYHRI